MAQLEKKKEKKKKKAAGHRSLRRQLNLECDATWIMIITTCPRTYKKKDEPCWRHAQVANFLIVPNYFQEALIMSAQPWLLAYTVIKAHIYCGHAIAWGFILIHNAPFFIQTDQCKSVCHIVCLKGLPAFHARSLFGDTPSRRLLYLFCKQTAPLKIWRFLFVQDYYFYCKIFPHFGSFHRQVQQGFHVVFS